MLEEQPQGPSLGMIIAKNTLVVTLGSVVLKAVNFLFNVYVIRRLGDDRFGQYSVVLAFVGIYQIFAELGISQFVMRESAKNREQAEPLFWNLVVLRAILAVIAMIAMPLLAASFGYNPQLVLGVFLFACSFLVSSVMMPVQGVITAYERFDIVTAQNILTQIVFVIMGGAFLLSGMGFIWLIVASVLSLVPATIMGIWFVRHTGMIQMKVHLEPSTWFGLIKSGLPFGIISLMLSIAFKIDTIILKGYTSDEVVGWYNAAYNLVFSLMFLTAGFKDAIVPSLTRTFVTDPQQVERWYYRTNKVMLILSLPIAVGGMLVSAPLIDLLYTQAYAPSGLALAILIWDVPFLMYASFCGNISTIIIEEKKAARVYAINAVINILMNIYAIPRFGLVGAAITTVLTDLIGSVQFYFMLDRHFKMPGLGLLTLKTLLASALMGAAVYLARDLHVFVVIGIGFVVYALLALVLRLFDENEWNMIGRLLKIPTKS